MIKYINNKPAFIHNNIPKFLGVKYNHNAKRKFVKSNIPILTPGNLSLPQPNVPILNQGQRSDCVTHGLCTMLMLARDSANLDYQLLSPTFLYDQINNGQDNGSDPADGIDQLSELGTCLNSTIPEDFSLDKDDIPQAAYTEALIYKIPSTSPYLITSFDQLISAFILGFKGGFTINVGNDFNLDQDGVVSYTPGQANHWVAVGNNLKQISNGNFALEFRNSWGGDWGINGTAFITAEHVNNQPYGEMYAIKYS